MGVDFAKWQEIVENNAHSILARRVTKIHQPDGEAILALLDLLNCFLRMDSGTPKVLWLVMPYEIVQFPVERLNAPLKDWQHWMTCLLTRPKI